LIIGVFDLLTGQFVVFSILRQMQQ